MSVQKRKTTLVHTKSPQVMVDWAPDKNGKQLSVGDVIQSPEAIIGAPARRAVGVDIPEGELYTIKSMWKEGSMCMLALTERGRISFKGLRSTLFVKIS